jgi:hypothetical protein
MASGIKRRLARLEAAAAGSVPLVLYWPDAEGRLIDPETGEPVPVGMQDRVPRGLMWMDGTTWAVPRSTG